MATDLIQAVITRAPTTIPAQDAAIMTWHLSKTTGAIDNTIRARIEGYLDTFIGAVKVFWPTYYTLSQYRWYTLDSSGRTTGAPARVTPKAIAGTGTGSTVDLPPQSAMTVTEKSVSRRRWGRFYLPVPRMTLTTSGRFSATQVDIVADAAEILYNAVRADAGVVFFSTRPRLDGTREPIDSLQIDDLVDIQRRRRWDTAAFRDQRTLV